MGKKLRRTLFSDTGNRGEFRRKGALGAYLAVKFQSKTVSLIPHLLKQFKGRRCFWNHDRILFSGQIDLLQPFCQSGNLTPSVIPDGFQSFEQIGRASWRGTE